MRTKHRHKMKTFSSSTIVMGDSPLPVDYRKDWTAIKTSTTRDVQLSCMSVVLLDEYNHFVKPVPCTGKREPHVCLTC